MNILQFVAQALYEDVREGDFSTLSSIPKHATGSAVLKIKEDGILAGLEVAEATMKYLQPDAKFEWQKKDGDIIKNGETAFVLHADVHTILKGERLLLNCMQRMSGIATLTHQHAELIKDYKAKVIDTRKTTPLFRALEKKAVKIGGGGNHRFGLYDMVMLKDNHIDYCGGIAKAIAQTNNYLKENNLDLKIEVETRNIAEVEEVLKVGNVHRIMLDNYKPEDMHEAVRLIDNQYETEASGGINLSNIVSYAQTGVDFISIGALTHHAVSLDLSLKALK